MSVPVKVYVPADKPVADAVVCPPGLQLYVYGVVPYFTPNVAIPSNPP